MKFIDNIKSSISKSIDKLQNYRWIYDSDRIYDTTLRISKIYGRTNLKSVRKIRLQNHQEKNKRKEKQ